MYNDTVTMDIKWKNAMKAHVILKSVAAYIKYSYNYYIHTLLLSSIPLKKSLNCWPLPALLNKKQI